MKTFWRKAKCFLGAHEWELLECNDNKKTVAYACNHCKRFKLVIGGVKAVWKPQ